MEQGDGIMGTFTLSTGLGMLAMGMVVIATMGLIILKVINTIEKNRIELEKRKEREKIYGSN